MSSSLPVSDDDTASSSSSAVSPADDCTIVALRSTVSATAAEQRLQCFDDGGVDRIVRPQPAMRTLTEEIQSVACFTIRDCEFEFADHPRMSLYASTTASLRGCDAVERDHYIGLSGMDWDTTTAEQRYAATTRLPHDEAMRLELNSFLQWVEDSMYVTIEEAKSGSVFCSGIISNAEHVRAERGRALQSWQTPYIVDLLCDMSDSFEREASKSDPPDDPLDYEIYNTYRDSSDAKPVSLLVLLDMTALCKRQVVRKVLATRVVLYAEAKKQIAEKAVAEAEAALRQQAKAKRRKLIA